MKQVLLLLLSLLTLEPSVRADLINLDDLKKDTVQALSKASGASASIKFCSGTFVSNDGYFLTALHCLMDDVPFEIKELPDFDTLLFIPDKAKIGVNPDIEIRLAIPPAATERSTPMRKAKVIALGKGFYKDLDHMRAVRSNPTLYSQLMDEGYGPPEDWALIKFDFKSNCVPSDDATLNPNTPVSSFQYSSREPYDVNRSATRSDQYFSSGIITHGVIDNTAFQSWISTTTASRDQILQIFEKGMDRDGTFATTVDAIPGSSGSGLFNSEAKLVGVINAVEWFGQNGRIKHIPGATQGVTLKKILKTISNKFSTDELQKMFSCK